MKKRLFISFLLLLLVAGVFFSCKKADTKHPAPDFPKKITFTEYSLDGTECRWMNLPYNNKVVVINSETDMEQYITCSSGSYPEVDFEKHTLLLASGICYNEVFEVLVKQLTQNSLDKYSLDITLTLNDTCEGKEWVKILIIDKIGGEAKVKLNRTITEQEVVYPIDVPYEHYSLDDTDCRWFYMLQPYTRVKIINRSEQLEEYLECKDGYSYHPPIDFSKHTLILVPDVNAANWPIIKLQLIAKKKYVLTISKRFNFKNISQNPVSILINKIEDDTFFDLIAL